jgi:hypothetical protein
MRNKSPISDDEDVDEEQETPSPRQSSVDVNDTAIGYRMEEPMPGNVGLPGESRRRAPPIPPFTLPPGMPAGMSQQRMPRPPPLARPGSNWRRNMLAAAVLLGLFAGGMLASGRAITLFGHTFRFRPSTSSTDDKGRSETAPGTGGSPLPETKAILPTPASPGTPLPEVRPAARPAAAAPAEGAAAAEPEGEAEVEGDTPPTRAPARAIARRNRAALRARADSGEPEVWLPEQDRPVKTRGRARGGRKDRGVEVQLF